MQASCSKCVLQQALNYTTRQAVPDQQHRLISKSQHNAVRQRLNRIGGSSQRSVSQEAVYAKTGPGGGVLDRPAVLPGFDNK